MLYRMNSVPAQEFEACHSCAMARAGRAIYTHIHIRGIHFHDDDNTGDCQNAGLLAVQPTDTAASPKIYSSGLSTYIPPVAYPGILFGGGVQQI